MKEQIQFTILIVCLTIIAYIAQQTKSISTHHLTQSSMSMHDDINVDEYLMDSIIPVDTLEQFFNEYEKHAQLYLDRDCFKGTPISGRLLRECAQNAYDSTGVIVPLELALSQAQWESGMGLKGRSPKNNPYNIGEWNTLGITTMHFHSTAQGVQAYYYLISKKYLINKNVYDLFINFVNLNGHRYAHSKMYEHNIKKQYHYISRWIEKSDTTL